MSEQDQRKAELAECRAERDAARGDNAELLATLDAATCSASIQARELAEARGEVARLRSLLERIAIYADEMRAYLRPSAPYQLAAGYDLLRSRMDTALSDALPAVPDPRDEQITRLRAALAELIEVADMRGDSSLPKPDEDPLPWTARMQTAWDDARAVIANTLDLPGPRDAEIARPRELLTQIVQAAHEPAYTSSLRNVLEQARGVMDEWDRLDARVAESESQAPIPPRGGRGETRPYWIVDAENQRLRAALEPFAGRCGGYAGHILDLPASNLLSIVVTWGDLRRVDAAIADALPAVPPPAELERAVVETALRREELLRDPRQRSGLAARTIWRVDLDALEHQLDTAVAALLAARRERP